MKRIIKLIALSVVLCMLLTSVGCFKTIRKKTTTKLDDTVVTQGTESDDTFSDDIDLGDLGDLGDMGDIGDLGDMDFSLVTNATVTFKTTPVLSNYAGLSANVPVFPFYPDSSLDNGGFTSEEIKLQMKRVVDAGIESVRAYGIMPGMAVDESDGIGWDWNATWISRFYKYAKYMKDNNIEIILNPNTNLTGAQYTEPTLEKWVKHIATENGIPTSNMNTDAIRAIANELYGEWMVEFVKEVIVKRGFTNITYFMHGTEVNNGKLDDMDACDNYIEQVRAVHDALKKAGYRKKFKFVGPNVAASADYTTEEAIAENMAKTKKWVRRCVETADECFDIYSAHDYWREHLLGGLNSDSYHYYKEFAEMVKSWVKETGKPIWIDEWGISTSASKGGNKWLYTENSHGYQVAMGLISQLAGGAQASQYWYFNDTKWLGNTKTDGVTDEGVMIMGLVPSVLQSSIPRQGYYAYATISQGLAKGDKIYTMKDESGWIHSLLVKHKNGKWSIISINASFDSTDISYKLPFNIKGNFSRIVYDCFTLQPNAKGTPPKATSTVKVNGGFKDNLTGYQVVVYNQK